MSLLRLQYPVEGQTTIAILLYPSTIDYTGEQCWHSAESALPPNICRLGLIPRPGIIYVLSSLLLLSYGREVFLWWFSPLFKNQHFQILIQSVMHVHL